MSFGSKIEGIVALLAVAGGVAAVVNLRHRAITLEGAVYMKDSDPGKELPIAGVDVNVSAGDNPVPDATITTDFSGYFRVRLRPQEVDGQPLTLHFRHPDYHPLDLQVRLADQLYLAHLSPVHAHVEPPPSRPEVVLSDVVVRYAVEDRTATNIGSAAKLFEVVNVGNVPCDNHQPCSPDGKWKAAVGGVTLDAGADNEFRNARLTCIAGPCPFTHIDSDGFSKGGRFIGASVRGWSDTTTFVLEAEVYRPQTTNLVQRSYPIILGRTLNFTLAASADGVSIEAEQDGAQVVFPFAPNGALSWAKCDISAQKDQAKLYRCELKPGYTFKDQARQ
jgi:hypothetical protein